MATTDATGAYSSVFGTGNTASGLESSVVGGTGNTASDTAAAILGGAGNQATNLFASVAGGPDQPGHRRVVLDRRRLRIQGLRPRGLDPGRAAQQREGTESTVDGGNENTAQGNWTAILGGSKNTVSAPQCATFPATNQSC
ncbi:MAG: hypothetical protein ABSH51_15360 [Solirubrobacteraceae bacterium]